MKVWRRCQSITSVPGLVCLLHPFLAVQEAQEVHEHVLVELGILSGDGSLAAP